MFLAIQTLILCLLPLKLENVRVTKVEPEAVTWWVFEGQRQLVSSQAEDAGADEWVDCTNCKYGRIAMDR